MRKFYFLSVLFSFLLTANPLFSKTITNKFNPFNEQQVPPPIITATTITSFSPSSGSAGTVVAINGTDFTENSVVKLNGITLSITSYSDTELKVVIPCGASYGKFTVDGVESDTSFTYESATISTPISNLAYCVGTTAPPNTITGTPSGVQFSWTNSNTTIGLAASGSGDISTFTAQNTTNEPIFSTITITPTINGCPGTTKTYTITVNPKPVANVITDITECPGTSINPIILTASSPNAGSGTSFSWSGTNNTAIGLTAISGTTSPIPSFTASNTSTSTISSVFTVIPSYNGCAGNPINFSINVNPPSVGGDVSPATKSICSGENSGILSLDNYVGTILRWESATNINGTWAPISNTSNTYQSGTLTQNTYFRAVVQSNGCDIVESNHTLITVNPTPSITGNFNICNGSSSQLIGSGTPAINNAWVSSNTGIATVSTNGEVTGVGLGQTIITYTNNNGCSVSVPFTVNGFPNVIATNPSAVCSPGTVNLTAGTITSGSTAGLLYSYHKDSETTITLNNPSSVAASGTYYIKGIDSNGCSSTSPVTVVINSIPTITINGNNSICSGNNTTLSASGANTYNWIGGLGTSANITVAPISDFTYTVIGTDSNGCEGTKSQLVTVNSLPTVNAGLDQSVCIGSATTLKASGNAVTFSWNNAITDNTPFTPTATRTYTLTGTAANGCHNTDQVLVTVNPIPAAPTLNIIQPTCTNSLGTIQFLGLPSGSWTINPDTYNGNQTTHSINKATGTYNFTVTDSNNCTSTASNATVNTIIVPAAPTIGSITQPTCINTTGSVILNNLPSTGNWTITKSPGGETYSNTGSSYTITNLSTGTYTFTVSNGSCTSAPSNPVIIDAVPMQTVPQIGSLIQPSCTVATGQATLIGLPSGNWTLTRIDNGSTIYGSGNSTTINDLATGSYNYTVTNANGCISVPSANVVINSQPATPAAPIANAQSFLTNDNATIADLTIISSETPVWYNQANGGTDYPNTTLLSTGIYYAARIVNGCESINRTAVNVSIFPNSVGGNVAGTTTVCSGTNSTVLTLSGHAGSIIRWESSTVSDFSSNVNQINIQNTSYTANNLTSSLYFRAVVQSGNSPLDNSNPAFINVTPPSIGGTLTATAGTAFCKNESVGTLTVSNYTGNIIRWEESTNSGATWTTIANISTTYSPGLLTTTTQYRVMIQNGNCTEISSNPITITIKNTPVVTDIPDQPVCLGDTKTFGEVFIANHSYTWSSDAGYANSSNNVSILFNSANTQTFTYTIKNNTTNCSVQDQFTVTTNALPDATVIDNTSICEGDSINIGANSVIGSTYNWTSSPIGFTSASSNPTISPVATTTYTLEETVTATGCKKTNSTTVTVQPKPTINIKGAPQIHICEDDRALLEATPANYTNTSLIWSKVIGTGNFNDTTRSYTEYTPSPADINNGFVQLRMTVTGLGPCSKQYSEDITIIIDKKPIANAVAGVITCGNAPVTIDATGTQFASSLTWTLPAGMGSISNANPYLPVYTPSTNAALFSPVTITLTASSGNLCPNSSTTVLASITPPPTILVNPRAATICEGNPYAIPSIPGALVTNYIAPGSLLWTTSGDGSFTSTTTTSPTYTPGANDIALGSVTLTATVNGNAPCLTPVSDSVILTIVKKPIVNAGADTLVCEGQINIVSSIQNAGTIVWTTNDGSGYFTNPNVSNPIYNPGASDLGNTVTFTVSVSPINGCGNSVSDSVLYTINANPIIDPLADDAICETNPSFGLNSRVQNASQVTWTQTGGTGAFDNANLENPTYNLSLGDKTAGSITFKVTADQFGCASVSETMKLTVRANPTVNAGSARETCEDRNVIILGSASNHSSVMWTKSGGSGNLLNPTNINPTYVPSANESGDVTLTLVAQGINPCSAPSTSTTTITVTPKPVARLTSNISTDDTICEGETYQVNSKINYTQATATNYSSLQWSTSGDGSFTNANTLTPIYTPGLNDISIGSAKLTLSANPKGSCASPASAQMTLTIKKIPTVNIAQTNIDACITDNSTPITGANAIDYDSLIWTTSGTGTFDNATLLSPTYTPSPADKIAGTVTLTFKAYQNSNCTASTSKDITLHFIEKPTADAGPTTAQICEGNTYSTNGATSNVSNVWWSTTGSGTWLNQNAILATYTPSSADYDAGFVDLTLHANPNSPCVGEATDVIRLNLQKMPVISVSVDTSICTNQNTFGIGGTTVTPLNSYNPASVSWTTSGTGTFSPTVDPLNPIYNASTDDVASGAVTLTLTVNSVSPCATQVSKSFVLSFQKLPVASAGMDLTKCDTEFQITTATADLSTVNNLEWSTSGSGTFDYTNILDPKYTPSAWDIQNSPITLTLTANAIAPCAVANVNSFQLTLVKSPTITTANQSPICEDATSTTILGTTVNDEASIKWTSTTGTNILNDSILEPVVTPSALDIANGYMDVTITATPIAPCTIPVSKTVRISIQKKPMVNAGTAQTICEGSVIQTAGALASNVTNLVWSNNGGDGTFTTSANNTVTEYTPGTNEIANGKVLLTITADAIAPCSGNVSSIVEHNITKNPVISISPTQVAICEDQTYTVVAGQVNVVNSESVNTIKWTTSNATSLTGSDTLTPVYTPSAADISAGYADLTLTVTPKLPCATPIVKTLRVTISPKATIDATQLNYTFCENTPKQLNAVFANHDATTINWRIVSGSGTLSGANTATPLFNPDTASQTVLIEVSAASISPCNTVTKKQFTLNVVKKPIVTLAKATDVICSSQLSYNLSGNTVTNSTVNTSYLWTTNGSGTFANNTAINTTYNFSAADLLLNTVTLKLKATSDNTCALTDEQDIVITIKPAPTAVTVATENTCEGAVFTASGVATNATTVLWTNVGTSNGTFTNANSSTAQYTPGTNDGNSFTLQFTATGDLVCSTASVTKIVTVQKLPIIDAGVENRTNCANQAFQITGVTGQYLGTILWSSNSTSGVNKGTFSNPSDLNPIYTPSAAEITDGSPIVLTVTANAIFPCVRSISDTIILNLSPSPTVNAGLDQTVCEVNTVSLTGSATNAVSVYWTSSSTGTSGFTNGNSASATYQPSALDIATGTVTLTLHATGNSNCPEVTDSTVVTILKNPTANAGANVSICEGSSYTLPASEATATHYSSVIWTVSGGGTLTNETTLTPTYTPTAGQTGDVTLTMTVTGTLNSGGNPVCTQTAINTKTITIVPKPIVSIPSSKTICEGETIQITNTDGSAINQSGLTWSSSNGLGTFTPNNAFATIYTPANGQTGNVTLSLTATSLGNVCTNTTASIAVTIIPKPIAEAGTNGSICQTDTYTVTGASVQNSTVFSWSINGPATIQTGTENTLSPVIVPNAGATGNVTVTLTSVSEGSCTTTVTDNLTISIAPVPVVNAGADALVCEGTTSFQLNGIVQNASNYNWTHTGSGTIQATANPLAPIYIPSTADFVSPNGINTITITLTANPNNGCANVSDNIQLTTYAKPVVFAGTDMTGICEGSTIQINNASAINTASVSWSTSGNGTFDYTNNAVQPAYTLGSNDTTAVTLTISAMPNAACPQTAVTDQVVVNINKNTSIVASSNEINMCGQTFTLPDLITVSDFSGIHWTNTTGVSGTPGVLTNASTETPTFSPSANEIANGFALLTVTSQPKPGCTNIATQTIKVNLQPIATVEAGSPLSFCEGEEIVISNNGAAVTNDASYTWSEDGTGSIDPATIHTLNPKYIPGTNETGTINFTLQATNTSPCSGLISNTVAITILPQATVDAGADFTICSGSNANLGNANENNTSSILWSNSQNSDGTSTANYTGGTFSNTGIINPSYTPSQDDIDLGYVYLTVKATNTACSDIVSDVLKVIIAPGVGVNAGVNEIVCEDSSFTLNKATSNATTVIWTNSQNSNGTSAPTYQGGSFSDKTALNPVYTPSTDDIALGYVYLTITGTGNSSCPINNSYILLNIVKKPTVSTTDVQMCINTPQIALNGTATNYKSVNWNIESGPTVSYISTNANNPLNPTFVSGLTNNETTNKTAVVRLYVEPNTGCPSTTAVYKDLTINMQALPIVEAGNSGTTCYISGQPIAVFPITETSVTNGGTQNWTTSGQGQFFAGNPASYKSLSNSCTTDVLTLTVNGTGACATSTVSDSVTLTVNCSIPNLGTITSSDSATICQGTTVIYTVPSNTSVNSYVWTIPSGATLVSGQNTNTITVDYNTDSISGNVSVYGTNSCGNSPISTDSVTVNSLPTGTVINGPESVCAGSNGNVYTAASIANANNYLWTLPNGSTLTTTTNSITITFLATDISGNLSVKGINSCGQGTASADFPITVIPKPTLSSTLTPVAMCSDSVFSYMPTSTTTNATFSWTRAVHSGISNAAANGTGIINDVLTNTTVSPIDVNYQYTITSPAPESCANTQNVTIRVNPIPVLTSTVTPAAICSGDMFGYTPTSSTAGSINWTRAVVSGISQTASAGSGTINEILTNTTTSAKTVIYLMTLPTNTSGCSATTEVTVTVNPQPKATILAPATVCKNDGNSFVTFTGSNGTAPYSFTYNINGGANQTINSTGNTALLPISNSVVGDVDYNLISVQDSNSPVCSQSQLDSKTVTVKPLPDFTVLLPTAVCAPNTIDLATTLSSADTSLTYTYFTDSAATIACASQNVAVTGTYYIKATNTFGCADIKPVTVTINPLPSAKITGTTAACKNSASPIITFTGSNGTAPYTFTYSINGGANQTIFTTSGNSVTLTVPTTTTGIFNYQLTSVQDSSLLACIQAQTSAATITIKEVASATISGDTSVCQNGLNPSISFTGSNGTAPYIFSYNVNGGANQTITSNDNIATLPVPTSTIGILTYNLVSVIDSSPNACKQLQNGSATVIVNSTPSLTVANPGAVCTPNTVDITNTASGSGVTYTYWNDISAVAGITNPAAIEKTGTYYIKSTDANSCFTVKPVSVTINPLPTATVSGTNSFAVCQNAVQPIITFTGSNATAPYIFQYQINDGAIQTVVSSATSNTATAAIPTASVGNYTINLVEVQNSSSSTCSNSNITMPNQALVNVLQQGTITPLNSSIVSQTICQDSTLSPVLFEIGGSAKTAYVTNLPTGLNGTYNSSTRTLNITGNPSESGTFNYTVHTAGSLNGCDSTYNGTITVNPNDSITVLTPTVTNQTICAGTAIQPITFRLSGGAAGGDVVFSPSAPAGISWELSSNTITISGTSAKVGTYTYTVQTYGSCGQTTYNGTIEIRENADVSLAIGTPTNTVCYGSSFDKPIKYSISPSTATMVLTGNLPTGVTFNPTSGFITGMPTQSGTFPYTIAATTGCGISSSGVIIVKPLQSITYLSGNTNQTTCVNSAIDSILFTVAAGVSNISVNPALPNGITYSLDSTTGILGISGTPTSATSLPQNYVLSTQGGCGAQDITNITLDIKPEPSIVYQNGSGDNNQAVCQSGAIVPITFSIEGGATGIVTPTLPSGLTMTYDASTKVYTIQGNPTQNGIFNIPITTTGCVKTEMISISNVNSVVSVSLTSGSASANQTQCQVNLNSPITPIIYKIIGATDLKVTGLPLGVTSEFSATTGQLIISGTPTQAGTFNYTITTLPCTVLKTGVLKISTPIFITNETVANVSCGSTNDGSISVTIVGGVDTNGLYAVKWSGPNGFQQNKTTINGLMAGDYTISGTDAIGCALPTATYTILPTSSVSISLKSATNVSCNGQLGCANFDITGGNGIYTSFLLQYLDPSSESKKTIVPPNDNYYNICDLKAGLYYLTVTDNQNCGTTPYSFTIYDNSTLSIESVTLDTQLCNDKSGKIRVKVSSLNPDLTFYYNDVAIPFTAVGNSIYELSVNNPSIPTATIKVMSGQDCWDTETVSTKLLSSDFDSSSLSLKDFGYYSVHESIQFTNTVDMDNIPAEYDYIVWDFGDNSPYKVFHNPEDLKPNELGENFQTVFHSFTNDGVYNVTMSVFNSSGCSKSITRMITVGSGANIMLPTIFSPNDDGINDYFSVSLNGIKEVFMYIYNEWGDLVYEIKSDVNSLSGDWGWNGIEKSNPQPINGSYRCYINAKTIDNREIEKEGRFLLVK